MSNFKVGQSVTWTSSSNGTTKTKTGVIETVIPYGRRLTMEQQKEADAYGMARDHESYLVRIPGATSKRKGQLYWPLVSKLKAV